MRTRYTLQELRALGVETVGRSAIIGTGPTRREFRAVGGEVVLDFTKMDPKDALIVGATLAELEAKVAELESKPAPEPPKKLTKNAGLTLGAD